MTKGQKWHFDINKIITSFILEISSFKTKLQILQIFRIMGQLFNKLIASLHDLKPMSMFSF